MRKIKPTRTPSGYMCPECGLEKEHAIQIYRHISLLHVKKERKMTPNEVYDTLLVKITELEKSMNILVAK